MGLLKKVAQFIIGKDPDIFDEKGNVRHKFTDAKWAAWNDRLKANAQYDWRKHVAVERVETGDVSGPRIHRKP